MAIGEQILSDANRVSGKTLRVLMVEDSQKDVELVKRELTKAGWQVSTVRVDTAAAMQEALASQEWDVILADYAVPGFGALPALEVLKQCGRDIPFIILSGIVSDEAAVAAMRAGAHDYLRKDNLSRLSPVIEREMQEAATRRQNRQMESTLRLQAAALNSAANSIVITNRQGAIQWVNSAFTALTGYTAAEAIGQTLRMLKSGKHDDQFYKEMWSTLLSGSAWRGEIINRRKDGSLYVEEMAITPIHSDDGKISHFTSVREDITERKRAEEALCGSEERFRMLAEYVKDYAIFMLDCEGRVITWNIGAQRLKGYTAEQILGQPFSRFYTPEDIADGKPQRELDLANLQGQYTEEGWRVRKDGSRFLAHVTITSLRGAAGQLIGFTKITRDITERKQAEEALRASQLKLQSIINSAMDAVISIDEQQRIVVFNRAAETIFQCSAANAIGSTLDRFIPKSLREVHRDHVRQFGLEGTGHRPMSLRTLIGLRYGGEEFPIEAMISQAETDGEKLYTVILRDITERKRVEETLRASEERFRALVTASSEAMYRMSPDWSEMRQLRGGNFLADTEEPTRDWLRKYIHPDDQPQMMAVIGEAIRSKSAFRMEHQVRRVDGSLGWTFSRAVPVLDAKGEIVEWFGAATDITERKQAEQALIRSEKLASVGRMAATIAHEINNPLAAAINCLYIANTGPTLPEDVRSNLILASRELARVSHITKQTLGFYKEVGSPAAVDLGDIVDSILDLYGPRLKSRNISLQRSYRCDELAYANEGEVRQIASNLIANSLDALPQNGKLHVRLFGPQLLYGEQRMLRMTIADDGEGIAPENLKRVYEPFFTTKQSIGTGLGLWVTGELVKKHEGRIRIRSRLGKGTVVAVWLPIERRGPERISTSTGEAARSILVVDDEQALATTLAAILARSGYRTDAVYRATEALARLDTMQPDLIVSDVMMPELNGLDFAIQVSKSHPGIKILLVSGHAGTQDLIETARSSGYSFELLAKPVGPEELLTKVAAMLDENSSPRCE